MIKLWYLLGHSAREHFSPAIVRQRFRVERTPSRLRPNFLAKVPLLLSAARASVMVLIFVAALSGAGVARGDTFTVTTAADAGPGSLRQVLADAPSGSVIDFAPALGGQTISLLSPLALSKAIDLDASTLSGGLTLSGGGASRIFTSGPGAQVTVNGCTLTGGNAFGGFGGAIINSGGSLTLLNCTLSGNAADSGGAIYSDTNLAGNVTHLINCTVTGNTAASVGGGIYNFDGRTRLWNCTVTGNYAPADNGGGIATYADLSTETAVLSSIIAGNATNDVERVFGGRAAFTSGGSNLIGTGSGTPSFNQPSDIINNPNPRLAPLDFYGGRTRTKPPLPGSPAIDAALAAPTAADQRGVVRPTGIAPDIGAVEIFPVVVTSTADSGPGSLRQAITEPFASSITFAPAFNSEAGDTILLASELVLDRALSIDASANPGGVTLSGSTTNRIFTVSDGAAVRLERLTLQNGNAGAASDGGAIRNDGNLMIANCTFSGNSAGGFGGAIDNHGGFLSLSDSTITGNSAAHGGGITSRAALLRTPQTFLERCTIAANTATNTGGGISAADGSTTLTHCTIANNTAPANRGGGIASGGDAVTETFVAFSIVAGNVNGDVDSVDGPSNSFTAGPRNLIGLGNGLGDFSGSGNLVGIVDPLLAPLGDYGGFNLTMALLPASPARDAALGSTASRDQRNFPIVATPDIGAYEAGTGRTFQLWAIENIGTAGAAFTGDEDQDGRENGLEYATLTAPLLTTSGPLPDVSVDHTPTEAAVTFPYLAASTDLLYEVQRSTTLEAWTTIVDFNKLTGDLTLHEPALAHAFNPDGLSITITDPFIAGKDRVFYRLRVSLP